jgi:phosphoglycolate phosphatase-like HAD superfamily hydrolase
VQRAERLLGERLASEQIAVVGDTPLDVAAAEGIGAVSVGVASGRYSAEQLRAAGADRVVESLAEPFPA